KDEKQGQQYQAYDQVNEDAKQQYRQNEAKEAAAKGAKRGAAKQGMQKKQQQQQQAQANAGASAFNQAYKSCLMGRGYMALKPAAEKAAQRYLAAKPGTDWNLDTAEIAAFAA